MDLNKYFPLDRYDRTARLWPALLTLAPAIVLFDCLFGAKNPVTSSIVSILATCGGGYALSRIARNAGKRIQDDLYKKWGGAPTTQLLRHRDKHIDVHTKERLHAILSKALKKPFPKSTDEQSDPDAADELYRASTTWLIGQTRGKPAFAHVQRENIAFGFQRNMLGLQSLGIIVSIISLGIALFSCGALRFTPPYFALASVITAKIPIQLSLSFSTIFLLAWPTMFNEGAVKRTAFAYAERLILSCDDIGGTPKGGTPKNKEEAVK
jgi:hypothetical protein